MAKVRKTADESDDTNPFVIDHANLDKEWIRQATLSRAAGRREADAKHEHAQAKAALDVVCARLRIDIRERPELYGFKGKPTVDQVESALVLRPEYADAVREVNLAKRDADYANADTIAFIDRRKGLERLVELLALDYYAEKEPQALSRGAREQADRLQQRAARSGIHIDDE